MVLISVAQVKQAEFAEKAPDLTLCDSDIPASYFGTYDFPVSGACRADSARRL